METSAALIVGYGATRFTEDADCLLDDAELKALVEEAGFEEAVARTNEELAPRGLYVSHIFGPEQEILTPSWRASCRAVPAFSGRLTVSVLGPRDLIVSKLGRGDEQDLEDVFFLMRTVGLSAAAVRQAVAEAVVPGILRDVFTAARARLELRLGAMPSGA